MFSNFTLRFNFGAPIKLLHKAPQLLSISHQSRVHGMYPISIAAVVVRLVLHRLLNRRELQTGEVLSLGLFEGG